jgi:tetratricopeptide (TPR) repeat protein
LIDFTGRGIAPDLKARAKLPVVPAAPAAPAKKKLSPAEQQKVEQLMDAAGKAHRQGKLTKVQAALEQVVEIDKENDLALFNLGIVLRDLGINGKAELMLRRAIKANPEKIECYQALGDMLFTLKHALSAAKAYEQGLERAPNNVFILGNLLRTRIAMRNPRDVESLARRILAIEPKEADVLCYLGWSLWLQKKDLAEAMSYVDQALELAPDHIRSMAVKERIASSMGDTVQQHAAEEWLMAKMRTGTTERHPCRPRHLSVVGSDRAGADLPQGISAVSPDRSGRRRRAHSGDHVMTAISSRRTASSRNSPRSSRTRRSWRCRARSTCSGWANSIAALPVDGDVAGGGISPAASWTFPVPEWQGEEIRDGKLVIYGEQGVGDHVMYAGHMIPARASEPITSSFEISPRQMSLFQRSFPDFESHRARPICRRTGAWTRCAPRWRPATSPM